ncbi:MAG: riboflavin synthase [Alphaproteobacteria bacterium]
MFSGVIQSLVVISDYRLEGDAAVITLAIDKLNKVAIGASIAINGICLTYSEMAGRDFVFYLSPETLHRTTAGQWKKNQLVNIEPSLQVGQDIGGHFVFGHIDGVGEVVAIKKSDMPKANEDMVVKLPPDMMPMMAVKGSIAIDGCALTINDIKNDTIAITLIPHTIEHTIAQYYQVGQKVNVEIDMLMRYVMKALEKMKKN